MLTSISRNSTDLMFMWQFLKLLSLVGSKTLGLNVLELHFVMLANHHQNV